MKRGFFGTVTVGGVGEDIGPLFLFSLAVAAVLSMPLSSSPYRGFCHPAVFRCGFSVPLTVKFARRRAADT